MKKFCIIFLLSIIISLTVLGFSGAVQSEKQATGGEYLRIHIRADSNSAEAQSVKYTVRDEVVRYLTPLVAEYQTKAQAMDGVAENLDGIAAVATETLHKKGFAYSAAAELAVENFPTRVYADYTLPAGEYSALIIRLGSGKGDNWWCVVYPPLCFATTDTDVVYKSKIKEIIENFSKKQGQVCV